MYLINNIIQKQKKEINVPALKYIFPGDKKYIKIDVNKLALSVQMYILLGN